VAAELSCRQARINMVGHHTLGLFFSAELAALVYLSPSTFEEER